jgi:hypothetical protein
VDGPADGAAPAAHAAHNNVSDEGCRRDLDDAARGGGGGDDGLDVATFSEQPAPAGDDEQRERARPTAAHAAAADVIVVDAVADEDGVLATAAAEPRAVPVVEVSAFKCDVARIPLSCIGTLAGERCMTCVGVARALTDSDG